MIFIMIPNFLGHFQVLTHFIKVLKSKNIQVSKSQVKNWITRQDSYRFHKSKNTKLGHAIWSPKIFQKLEHSFRYLIEQTPV